jgi:hypothetical protein
LAGLSLAVGLLLLLPAPVCRADLVPISFPPNGPLISGINGSLTYKATTEVFHIDALPLTYAPAPAAGGFATFAGTAITIDLKVDSTGAFISNGAGLTVTGSLDLDGDGTADATGTLLTGQITNFGADPAGPPTRAFDGLFTIEGGLLTTNIPLSGGGMLFGGFTVGQKGGFILNAENVTKGNLGDFSSDFASSQTKVKIGPAVPVPEPAAGTLALIGALGLGAASLCRRGRRPS